MGRMITKRIRPTLKDAQLHKFGRQSSMRRVYVNKFNDTQKPTTQELPKEEAPQKKVIEKEVQPIENKSETKEKDTVMMDTKEKVELASAILTNENTVKAKRIRKDKGLIERKENTIILTEDNRELLND